MSALKKMFGKRAIATLVLWIVLACVLYLVESVNERKIPAEHYYGSPIGLFDKYRCFHLKYFDKYFDESYGEDKYVIYGISSNREGLAPGDFIHFYFIFGGKWEAYYLSYMDLVKLYFNPNHIDTSWKRSIVEPLDGQYDLGTYLPELEDGKYYVLLRLCYYENKIIWDNNPMDIRYCGSYSRYTRNLYTINIGHEHNTMYGIFPGDFFRATVQLAGIYIILTIMKSLRTRKGVKPSVSTKARREKSV